MKNNRKLSKLPGLSRQESYLTNWAARLYARAVDRALAETGLSSGQLPVFFALASGRKLAQKELAEMAAVEQPTMAATLARMEREGLVERSPHPGDRRSSLIGLSPAAAGKARSVQAAVATVNAASLRGFSRKEEKACRSALQRVIANLEREVGRADLSGSGEE